MKKMYFLEKYLRNSKIRCTFVIPRTTDKQLKQATAQVWGGNKEMKTLYYTKGEALMAAMEAVKECNGTIESTSVDNRTRGLEEDDRFAEIVDAEERARIAKSAQEVAE